MEKHRREAMKKKGQRLTADRLRLLALLGRPERPIARACGRIWKSKAKGTPLRSTPVCLRQCWAFASILLFVPGSYQYFTGFPERLLAAISPSIGSWGPHLLIDSAIATAVHRILRLSTAGTRELLLLPWKMPWGVFEHNLCGACVPVHNTGKDTHT